MAPTALVIDANSVIARSIYASALDDLRAGGVFTGGVYGALGSLRSIVNNAQVRPGLIVAFFDKGVPPARMKLLPDYKQKRKERKELLSEDDKEKAFEQIRMCYDLWPLLGVQCLAYRDREADDGVAAAARELLRDGIPTLIVSSDKDLWQTVNWGARVWDLSSQEIIGLDNFEEFSDGVAPDRWLLYRAIVGDSSDSIAGVPGCGPKRARQLLEEASEDLSPEEPDPHVQLRELCASVRDRTRNRTPRAFERGLLAAESRLHDVLRAIDLWDSFGKREGLRERLQESRPVQVKAFLKQCSKLKFASVLGDPATTLDPFQAAEKRRLR